MARELFSADDESITDIVVTELLDDPPFHKQAVGKLKRDGVEKFFSYTYNINTVHTAAPRIHEAVLRPQERQ